MSFSKTSAEGKSFDQSMENLALNWEIMTLAIGHFTRWRHGFSLA